MYSHNMNLDGSQELDQSVFITWKQQEGLDRYKEEIRNKYLVENLTLDELLLWLRVIRGMKKISKHQLTYQLSKWGYFKKRSHLRRKVIKNYPQDCQGQNTQGDQPDVSLGKWWDDSVIITKKEKRADHREEQSPPTPTADCVSESSEATKPDQTDGYIDEGPTLAASITSSGLSGLHSMRSLARRIQAGYDTLRSSVSLSSGYMSIDNSKYSATRYSSMRLSDMRSMSGLHNEYDPSLCDKDRFENDVKGLGHFLEVEVVWEEPRKEILNELEYLGPKIEEELDTKPIVQGGEQIDRIDKLNEGQVEEHNDKSDRDHDEWEPLDYDCPGMGHMSEFFGFADSRSTLSA